MSVFESFISKHSTLFFFFDFDFDFLCVTVYPSSGLLSIFFLCVCDLPAEQLNTSFLSCLFFFLRFFGLFACFYRFPSKHINNITQK